MAGNDVKFRVSVDTGTAPQELNELGQAVDRVSKEADGLEEAGRRGAAGTDKLGSSASQAGDLLKNLGATIAAGFTFDQLVTAAAQFESVKAGLQAVTGSAAEADEQMEFIRQTANRVGADINEVGAAFLGLAAATKGTAVEGEPTRQVFEAVANAMSKAGKSSAETQNALTAIAQIASKGTVSMEELRGQLGEALPGALQAASSGLGVTTEDLIKLVEEGQVAAEDLFPALTKGLNDLYGGSASSSQTLAQEITNVKNAFIELAADIGEAGGLDALKTGAEIAGAGLVLLNDALVSTGKTIGVLAGAVATLDFSQLSDAFAEIEQESRDKLLKAAQHNAVLAGYVGALGDEATRTALKMQQAGQATQVAGEQAAGAAGGYTKLNVEYQKARAEIDKQIEGSKLSREAREAEAKTVADLANLFGTEAEKRAAAVQATRVAAEELNKEAVLRQLAADKAREELAEKQKLLDQGGPISEQRKKQIEELQKEVEKRQDVADKTRAQADSAMLSAEAAKVEAATAADNSSRLAELAKAYEETAQRARDLADAKAAGLPVDEKLKEAQLAAAEAGRLYRDALSDQTAMLKATGEAKRADLELTQEGLNAQLEQYRSLEATARAIGDENLATYAKVEAKKIEIQLIRVKVEIMRAEAEGAIAVANATRVELEASGQLTAVKRIELDTAIKVAQAKLRQADATGEATKIAQLELDALRNGTSAKNANADAADRAAGSVSKEADSRRKNADAIEGENSALERRKNLTADGFERNADGSTAGTFNNSIPVDKAFKVMQAANRGDFSGLTEEEVRQAFQQAKDAKEWLDSLSPGSVSLQAKADADGAVSAARTAMEALGLTAGGGSGFRRDPTPSGNGMMGSAAPGGGGFYKPVTININGTRQTVNVAGDQDAASLEQVLRQLTNDAGRA